MAVPSYQELMLPVLSVLADQGAMKTAECADRAALKKSQSGHLVLREDLERAIKFFRLLVEKTDAAFEGR